MRLAAGALMLIVIAWFFVRDGDTARKMAQPPPGAEKIGPVRDSPVAARPAASSPQDFSTLPPPDTPLAQVMDTMRAAADAGNANAGCRLAMELLRCKAYRRDVQGLVRKIDLERLPPDSRARLEALNRQTQAKVDRLRPICDGVPEASEREAWKLLLAAAREGHVASMSLFGRRRGFGGYAIDEFDLEPFAAYRMHGLQLLTDAAAAGDARAYGMLGNDMLQPRTGTRAIPYDPVRGLAYLKAYARNSAEPAKRGMTDTIQFYINREKVSPADVMRADVLADDLEKPLRDQAPIKLRTADEEEAHPEMACGQRPGS